MGSDPEHVESIMKSKFKLLFEKINKPNYVMDNYYSDNLINKLVETRKDNNYICTLSSLIVEPIQNLERYHVSVQVFLVRLLAFVCHKELFFAKIMNDINDSLKKGYSNLASPTTMPSLSVAYLDVALSLVEHCTSLYWLLDSEVWKEILSANESKTVFVSRKKYKFVSRLVWRLNGLEDESNVKQVLAFILKPLIETGMVISESTTAEEEEEASKQFEPMLHMLHSIMSDYSQLTRSSLVINTLLTHFKLVTQIYVILDRFRKDSLTSLIAKLVFRLVLTKVFHAKPLTEDSVHTAEDFVESSVAYFNTVNLFIRRRNATSALDYCYSCHEIWNATWHNKMTKMITLDGKEVDLQNKMLFLCLVPVISYLTRYMPPKAVQMSGNIQDYVMKLINASCEHTTKTAWALSHLILELDTETIVLQSVKRLTSLNTSMNNEQANLMFQGLFYVLKQFDPLAKLEDSQNSTPEAIFQEDQENLFLYTYVLEAILLLVKNYDINWQESLEVICLYNVVSNILRKPNLSNKCTIRQLLEESILNVERYHVSVQVFLVKLLAVVVREELCFTKTINSLNHALCKACHELESPKMTPSLRVAYLDVALSLIMQNIGLYWLLESNLWKEILRIDDESNTVFVKRQKFTFASKLVWRLNALEDDANVRQVLNFILTPLSDTTIVIIESITTEEEDKASKQLEPMLLMLQSMTSEYRELSKSSLVVNALLNHFKLGPQLCVLLDRFRKNSLTTLLGQLIFRLALNKVLHYKPLTDDTVYNVEDFVETRAFYFNTIDS